MRHAFPKVFNHGTRNISPAACARVHLRERECVLGAIMIRVKASSFTLTSTDSTFLSTTGSPTVLASEPRAAMPPRVVRMVASARNFLVLADLLVITELNNRVAFATSLSKDG